jgi:hypothetical protein
MNQHLIFGIYPGSGIGTDNEPELAKGKPDNPIQIKKALVKLENREHVFLIRCYLHYIGNGKIKNLTPENPTQYLTNNRKLDLVLGYQSSNGDIEDWTKFVRQQIALYGDKLAKIQIAEEPNLHNIPYVDGDSPNVRQAVIEGVVAAKNEIIRRNLDIAVGFNGVPTFNEKNDFWREIGRLGTHDFYNSLDYVGLDFFPDVFRPILQEELPQTVEMVLKHYRNVSLGEASIPYSVPIHITENGWATSPERSEKKQADVIEVIIRAIYEYRKEYNITHYEMFDLRDADSQSTNFFYQFGIMKDDYSVKPVFEVYRKLIEELG